jgi:hypothetical protein
MRQAGLYCQVCDDLIFSNSRHDFVSCACGEIFIDGGFDYVRIGAREEFPTRVWRNIDKENLPNYYETEVGWQDRWVKKDGQWHRLGRKVALSKDIINYTDRDGLHVARKNWGVS